MIKKVLDILSFIFYILAKIIIFVFAGGLIFLFVASLIFDTLNVLKFIGFYFGFMLFTFLIMYMADRGEKVKNDWRNKR